MLEGKLYDFGAPLRAVVLQVLPSGGGGCNFRPSSMYCGEVPEWPKGTDCKSVGSAFEGSNPSLPIFLGQCGNSSVG